MDPSTARALSSRLADLLSREQSAMADFLVALAGFDRRRLWEPLGYTSLWHYLHRELGLSVRRGRWWPSWRRGPLRRCGWW